MGYDFGLRLIEEEGRRYYKDKMNQRGCGENIETFSLERRNILDQLDAVVPDILHHFSSPSDDENDHLSAGLGKVVVGVLRSELPLMVVINPLASDKQHSLMMKNFANTGHLDTTAVITKRTNPSWIGVMSPSQAPEVGRGISNCKQLRLLRSHKSVIHLHTQNILNMGLTVALTAERMSLDVISFEGIYIFKSLYERGTAPAYTHHNSHIPFKGRQFLLPRVLLYKGEKCVAGPSESTAVGFT
ncbi:hypothetical protein K469DRAFT_747130 [Zopfia rhizophila CBS 207.26]|uniref:Uncharacterized protein n=1 Tax=Zopfia rhizophila CBS 207.26 TaxID=1314779 RepID=A0A6A6EHC7_9PEZI|nr:hypothetical protein K469DRAFT_747130 [Zopfia rhizophila CBS 207.26]